MFFAVEYASVIGVAPEPGTDRTRPRMRTGRTTFGNPSLRVSMAGLNRTAAWPCLRCGRSSPAWLGACPYCGVRPATIAIERAGVDPAWADWGIE